MSQPTPPFRSASGRLEVHQIPAWTDNFIYLVVDRDRGEAAVVDGPEAGPALAAAERLGVPIRTVLNTHTHGDHVGINRDLESRGLLSGMTVFGPKRTRADVPGITHPVTEGSSARIGAVEGTVYLTEGHMNGHVSYCFEDLLFCGDTLFAGGCGYVFDGPYEALHASLRKLAAMPGDTRVLCAHEYTQDNLRFAWFVEPGNERLAERIRWAWGARGRGGATVPSRLEEELATNPFLRGHVPALRTRVAEMMGTDLASDLETFIATRKLKDRKDHRALSDADLPL